MRFVGVLVLAVVVVSAVAAYAEKPSFNLESVASGVYVHLGRNAMFGDGAGHDDIANLGLVVGSKCAAVVDTGGSVATGKAFRAAVAKVTDKSICYVINTHGHPDHILGNSAFEQPGTVFVGSATLPGDIAAKRKGYIEAFPRDLGSTPKKALVAPTKTVAVGQTLTLDLGDRKLLLHAWPPAHTTTDLTVLDEKTKTLFTGDLVFRKRVPSVSGHLDGWLKVLDALQKIDAKLVVPGHGPVGHDLEKDIAPERAYFKRLRKKTCTYIHNGGSMLNAPKQVMTANRQHWLLWKQRQPLNVSAAYLELQMTCF